MPGPPASGVAGSRALVLETTDPSWLSLLPPLIAIALAIRSRQVHLSLLVGVWMGGVILTGGRVVAGLAWAIDAVVDVLASAGNARAILFTLVVGSLIATIEQSGGVAGFVRQVERGRWVTDGRRSQLLAWLIGVVIFIESNITVLLAGSVARPLFDRFRVSREKLAYIIDSTSAPICILIPLNAWGAYNLGLLDGIGVERSWAVFLAAIPYNFYPLAAVTLTLCVIGFGWNWGPMRAAEARAGDTVGNAEDHEPATAPDLPIPPRARNMLLPIVAMVLAMPLGLWITGNGDFRAGSGSKSVLWAVLAGLAFAWLLMLIQRAMGLQKLVTVGLKGAADLLPLAVVLLFAIALGDVADLLGTGPYVAGLVQDSLPVALLLPAIFIVSSMISFSIGSSWGTFAIVIPIAVPISTVLGLDPAPFLAAALSGGIFGDHCSPISDTTIVASMVSGADHVDHVKTQLPYALVAGAAAVLGFTAVGLLL